METPEDNVRSNGYIEILEREIENYKEAIPHESLRGGYALRNQIKSLQWAILMYRNYLDRKEG